ncbi:MAG: bifunctional phosphoribosylaminoimidazolecarboxamide formyltransferase/IMP cyclohydrolase [Ignavibacteriaceae bacterium]|nr:bifunctional phosphoribosylaminoimidazolecarboxamide formyltransferase/IMP cyclohydrolase [Ignavibacteriaceae bacterium]
MKINRVLLSVNDKRGLLGLAKCLHAHNCELISTGGTGKCLSEAGIPFTEISKITGKPEAFGGRMKSISFEIESAILFDRVRDKDEAANLHILPIDMVVCNLYDFKKYKDENADLGTLIEHIDIGGSAAIRSAAKNFMYVAPVTDPDDYPELISELNSLNGSLSLKTRKKLMAKAFNLTADYDSMIAQAMDQHCGNSSLRISLTSGKDLRYGENPHQPAKFYKVAGSASSLYNINVLNGIGLSYNNILDLQAAVESVSGLRRQSCVIVKHSNPCGMASGDNQKKVFELAWAGDPISAFGGIVAFNVPVSVDTISFLGYDDPDKSKRRFIEIIAAPSFNADALKILNTQKNLRIVEWRPDMLSSSNEIRITNGLALVQAKDSQLFSYMNLMTKKLFNVAEYSDIIKFGLVAVRQIKSNAIAVVQKRQDGTFQLLGMGSGQPNRLDSINLALNKARYNFDVESPNGHYIVLVSDAFFPFEDNVDAAFKAGIKILVQPGGSIRDKHVIARADELGINLIFTGIRHFKH